MQHKPTQTHDPRALGKAADNRYWQDQTRVDDVGLGPNPGVEPFEPPTLPADGDAVEQTTPRG
jgi:hypothetical protein